QLREQMERDMALARQLQRSILPERVPELAGYEFFAHYAPLPDVRGDFYDFISLPERRLAVSVGHVAAHGLPAAQFIATIASQVRSCLWSEADAAAAVTRLSNLLLAGPTQDEKFATLAVAVLDPASHQVIVVSAGHLSPVILRKTTGRLEEAVPRELT